MSILNIVSRAMAYAASLNLPTSLLQRSEAICLTVNEKSAGTQQFYKQAGYELVSRYDSIYLDKPKSSQSEAA